MPIDDKKPLGRILIKQKLVSEQQITSALRDQHKDHGDKRPLASQLTDTGVLQEVDALRALSEQHGVPGIDLGQIALLLEHLAVVPREMCESHQILPVLLRGDRIFLAMANPKDKRVIDELEFVTGKKVYPYIALTTALTRAIAAAYDAKSQGDTYYFGPRVPKETLTQLGLTPQTQEQARRMPSDRAPAMSAPDPVVDKSMQGSVDESVDETDFSTVDFGNVSADISTVSALPEELRKAPSTSPTAPAGGGKLIMIVDDEEDIRKLLKRVFVEKGHRVIEADRGLLALRMVKQHMPDLLILDAMLPELHGFDIARRLKGSEKYGSIPIIMISAVYRGWRVAEDLKSSYGIQEYLEKPFRIVDVMNAATRALSHAAPSTTTPHDRDPEVLSAEAEKALTDGIAAYKAGDVDRAVELLKSGTHIDPLAYRLHFHLALLYGKKGLIFDGIAELEKAIELNPKHFPALKNLAVLYEKAGFKHRAVEMWERCVHASPDAETRGQIKEHLMRLL
jgi:DNA-binding response OmpR family regulator